MLAEQLRQGPRQFLNRYGTLAPLAATEFATRITGRQRQNGHRKAVKSTEGRRLLLRFGVARRFRRIVGALTVK